MQIGGTGKRPHCKNTIVKTTIVLVSELARIFIISWLFTSNAVATNYIKIHNRYMYQLSCLIFHITYTNKVWKPINYDLITSNMDRIMKLNL